MAVPTGDLWTSFVSENTEQKVASAPQNLWLKEKREHKAGKV